MNFASFDFWMFLVVGTIAIRLIRLFIGRFCRQLVPRYDAISLLTLSLSLLFRESPLTLGAFLYVIFVIWFGTKTGIRLPMGHRRSVVLGLTVAAAVLPLVYFKYANFLTKDVLKLPDNDWGYALIPAGLSFYTFQMIGFIVDRIIRDEHSSLPLIDYINFASFFPQIVAGPIERAGHLLPQVHSFSWKIDPRNLDRAVSWIIYGLFLKMAVANNIAEQSQWVQGPLNNPFQIWLGNLLFAYRIYFDFAGYSFIAVGLGKIYNIDLTINFRSPYTALNIQDFWRRWHITLSGWFRDYVYVPLGGGKSKEHVTRNILIVFTLSGIWHGAGWNFVLWGFYHGLLLCLFRVIKPYLRLPGFVSWAVCFVLILGSWLLFYETNIDELANKIAVILNPIGYTVEAMRHTLDISSGVGRQATLALALVISLGIHLLEYISFCKAGDHAALFLRPASTVTMAVLTVMFAPTADNGFIYFNF